MKFQYASDLHLELFSNLVAFSESKLIPSAPILILAGDIDKINLKNMAHSNIFNYFAANWEQVYIIPGNHEFYNTDKVEKAFNFELEIFPNVNYINNQLIEIEGIEFYFTTLWSQCNSPLVENYIADFRYCQWGNEKYTWKHHNNLHKKALEWLNALLTKPKTKPRVVVSHFVPSDKVNAYPDGGDNAVQSIIKSYFVANIDNYLTNWDIDYWVYGHNHWNNDVDEFGIKFRSNMQGYIGRHETKGFKRDKTIEIA